MTDTTSQRLAPDAIDTTDQMVDSQPSGPPPADSGGLAPETASTEGDGEAAFEPTPLFATRPAMPLTPEASPDGAWLAYLLEGADGRVGLWLSPIDGGDPRPVDLPFEPVVERDPDTGRLMPPWKARNQRIPSSPPPIRLPPKRTNPRQIRHLAMKAATTTPPVTQRRPRLRPRFHWFQSPTWPTPFARPGC